MQALRDQIKPIILLSQWKGVKKVFKQGWERKERYEYTCKQYDMTKLIKQDRMVFIIYPTHLDLRDKHEGNGKGEKLYCMKRTVT